MEVVESLFEGLGFHDLGVFFRAMHHWADVLGDSIGIDPNQQLKANFFGHAFPEGDHVMKFPASVNMHERKRNLARMKRLLRQSEHH